jgi:serine protease Do
VILRYDGAPVEDYRHLQRLVAETAVGKAVALEVLRDRKRIQVTVTVAENPPESARGGGASGG